MKKKLPVIFFTLVALYINVQAQVIQTTFLTQNFQGTGLPAGWQQTTLATDGGWKFGSNTAVQSGNFAIPAHTKFACTNDDACNCDKSSDRLITDTVDLTTAATVVLKFDYYFLGIGEIATIEVSNDNGATWLSVDTLVAGSAWQTKLVDISSVAVGSPAVLVSFLYNDLGSYGYGLAVDDVLVYQPVATDAALTSVTPLAFESSSYGTVGTNITIGGTVFNYGASPITSCNIKWTDGTNTYSYPFSGVIPVVGSASFTHSQTYPIVSAGAHPISVWVELANDTLHNNDTLSTIITGAAFIPAHKTTIEDHTVCSSGFGFYSARGIVMKDSFVRSAFGSLAEIISVHWKGYSLPYDPMYDSIADYANASQTVFASIAWPEVHIDRKKQSDVTFLFDAFAAHTNDFGIADVAVNLNYDSATRALVVTADAHFAVDVAPASGLYQLAYVLTEDSVHSTDTVYSQRNAYTQGSNGPLAGAGIDFAAEPDPVSASKMYYMNVARTLQPGFTGATGSLPASIAAGSTWSYTFDSYTVPAIYNASKMRAIVLLINSTTGRIMNANGSWLTPRLNSGILAQENSDIKMNIFPNPFTEQTTLTFKLDKPEEVTINITNTLGEMVSGYTTAKLPSGEHVINIDGKNLSSGLYLVNLKAGNSSTTGRISVAK